jgi:hypothetical protein
MPKAKPFKKLTLRAWAIVGSLLFLLLFIEASWDFAPGNTIDERTMLVQAGIVCSIFLWSLRIVAGAWNNFWFGDDEQLRSLFKREFPDVSSLPLLGYKVFWRSAVRTFVAFGVFLSLAILQVVADLGYSCIPGECTPVPGMLPAYVYLSVLLLSLGVLRVVAANRSLQMTETSH